MYRGTQSLSSNGDIHMCRYACALVAVVVVVLALMPVLMPPAVYLYGRLRDTDAKQLLELSLTSCSFPLVPLANGNRFLPPFLFVFLAATGLTSLHCTL